MRQKNSCIVVESVGTRRLHSMKFAAAQLNKNQTAF
jgi:hypothetical protein